MSTFLNPHLNHRNAHLNHGRRRNERVESEEDYHTYITRLEKKTSMIDGPRFGNMQHAFKRVEVYEEVDNEFEATGRFGTAKHVGKNKNNDRRSNICEVEGEAETEEYFEYKKGHQYRNY